MLAVRQWTEIAIFARMKMSDSPARPSSYQWQSLQTTLPYTLKPNQTKPAQPREIQPWCSKRPLKELVSGYNCQFLLNFSSQFCKQKIPVQKGTVELHIIFAYIKRSVLNCDSIIYFERSVFITSFVLFSLPVSSFNIWSEYRGGILST